MRVLSGNLLPDLGVICCQTGTGKVASLEQKGEDPCVGSSLGWISISGSQRVISIQRAVSASLLRATNSAASCGLLGGDLPTAASTASAEATVKPRRSSCERASAASTSATVTC